MTVTQLIQKFEQRKKVVRSAVQDSFNETSKEWVELNQDQLAAGERNDGTLTKRNGVKYYPYAPQTLEHKEKQSGLSAVTDVVTLFDKGSFYMNMKAKQEGMKIFTFSTDSKSNQLEEDYNKGESQIFGVNPENKKYFIFTPYWSVLRKKLEL